MFDKYLDLSSIKNHPAHRQIVYSQIRKSPKSINFEISLKKRGYISLSLDFSSKDPKFPKDPDQPSALPRKIAKSPE